MLRIYELTTLAMNPAAPSPKEIGFLMAVVVFILELAGFVLSDSETEDVLDAALSTAFAEETSVTV